MGVTSTPATAPAAAEQRNASTVAAVMVVILVLLALLAALYLRRKRSSSVVEAHRLAVPADILAEVCLAIDLDIYGTQPIS